MEVRVYDESAFEQQLRTTRAALRQLQDSTPAAPAPEPVTVERMDGQVRVTVDSTGRLTTLDVRPAALREGVESVSAAILDAVNACLDAQSAGQPAAEAAPDLGSLLSTVERLQDDGLRQMRQFTDGIGEALRRVTPNQR